MKYAQIISAFLVVASLTGAVASFGQGGPIAHELDLDNFVWCSLEGQEKAASRSTGSSEIEMLISGEIDFLNHELRKLRSELTIRSPLAYEHQGIFTSIIESPDTRSSLSLSYRWDLSALRQLNKYVFQDEDRTQRDDAASYLLTIHDNGQFPSSFARNNGKITLNFHKNGVLSTAGIVIGGTYYWFKWDDAGRLLGSRESKTE